MINSDDVVKENIKKHNPKTSDHPFRILIIGGSGSGKANSLFNLINRQPDTDKIYFYTKDLYEAKYQFLINNRESASLKHFNDSKAFIEYSNNIVDIYKNNPSKTQKILIIFDDIFTDMLSNKKPNPIVTELSFRGMKLNTYLAFIT